jgi:putative NADPH-quinone reductase
MNWIKKKKQVVKLTIDQMNEIYNRYGEDYLNALKEIPDEQHLDYIDYYFIEKR